MMDDIEIYAKNLSLEAITQWLQGCFEQVSTIYQGHNHNLGKAVHDLEVMASHKTIPVMIVEGAVGKAWTSVWFKTSGTPWKDDTECARSLHANSPSQVRCNSGPWQEGADMDEWWAAQ